MKAQNPNEFQTIIYKVAKMYKVDEILREVEKFLMDSIEEVDKMKQDCQRVLDMYKNESIEDAFKQICDWVQVYGKVIPKYADLYQESFILKCRKNVVKLA